MASREKAEKPGTHVPLRRNPAVVAGLAAAGATIFLAIANLFGTIVTAHANPVPLTSCAIVFEQYETDVQRDPAAIAAIASIAAKDPNAHRCGINAPVIRQMSPQ
jgi:hypothetical protein